MEMIDLTNLSSLTEWLVLVSSDTMPMLPTTSRANPV